MVRFQLTSSWSIYLHWYRRLHRPAYSVTFNLKNTGSVPGTEVQFLLLSSHPLLMFIALQIPQLYVNMPASAGEPPSLLKGFTNIELQAGEKKSATINLSRYDLSIWDTVAQGWRRPQGTIRVTVGASSRDGRLEGTIPSY
jgi:hypothetical protein